MPELCLIANLWTLWDYPVPGHEWDLDTKLDAIQEAGFDGVCWAPSDELTAGCERRGLVFVGGMAGSDPAEFPAIIEALRYSGTPEVNVQLGRDDMLTPEALELALRLYELADAAGLHLSLETHRGTCTETPEKMYALADAFRSRTGKLLPISFDFSHFAVVKHLVPENFAERLLVRPELVQHARQFHFRPFNGHHAQVPITDGEGRVTQEVREWIPFAEEVLRCWLGVNKGTDAALYICPELGPVRGGYALSTFPPSWEDAKVLGGIIRELWVRVIAHRPVR